jgi:DHA1 family bicyclomycin/chloramphenicol resistance-like MFS transporter
MATSEKSKISKFEFTSMMALLMSLVALSIDAILPALTIVAKEYSLSDPNDAQLLVSMLFVGLAFGQILYGPLSDSIGRKKAILIGMSIFLFGNLLSYFSHEFHFVLLGRVFQGFGAASARIVTIALIRDRFVGAAMAKIMSLIMTIFILVPAIAPFLGQWVMDWTHWRDIFLVLFSFGLTGLLWFYTRQEETLNPNFQKEFNVSSLWQGVKEVLSTGSTLYYILAAGCVYGAFVGYLNSSQQIFVQVFQVGDHFPEYFALLALSIGSASFCNSTLVSKFGMRKLVWGALLSMTVLSFCYLVFLQFGDAQSLVGFLIYMMLLFFCIGILFGNFNALAMEPLGHIAGIGSAVAASLQTFISVPLGVTIGQFFDGSVYPLVIGFFVLIFLAILSMSKTKATPPN